MLLLDFQTCQAFVLFQWIVDTFEELALGRSSSWRNQPYTASPLHHAEGGCAV